MVDFINRLEKSEQGNLLGGSGKLLVLNRWRGRNRRTKKLNNIEVCGVAVALEGDFV